MYKLVRVLKNFQIGSSDIDNERLEYIEKSLNITINIYIFT